MVCNPNSPTGRACAADEVMQVVRSAQRRGMCVIVDETFADYCPARSILPAAIERAGTIVLRSFTKFYGLPGLRIGYALAAAETATRLRDRQPPWSVNAPAQEAARAALKDQGHAERSRKFMAQERSRVGLLLARLPGCTVFPSEANFFLLELAAGRRAAVVTEQLRRQGMLIRDCSGIPGLNERTIRVAIRTRADNDRLLASMQRTLATA
jgi:threonine-phosphate decarboxylase